MALLDAPFLLLTGLIALYLTWRFSLRWRQHSNTHDKFYAVALLVLLVSGLLLISFGYDILASPYVLTVASLIPLDISLGPIYQHYPSWKQPFTCFALTGLLGIALTGIGGLETAKMIAVPSLMAWPV